METLESCGIVAVGARIQQLTEHPTGEAVAVALRLLAGVSAPRAAEADRLKRELLATNR